MIEPFRPAAIIDMAATTESVFQITQRLNGMYWKGRQLHVQTILQR